MKIRFTKQSYESKEEALASFGHQEWLETEGDFNLAVYLFQSGHIINISDRRHTDTVILDLDGPSSQGLSPEQMEQLANSTYLKGLQERLGAKRLLCFDSASRCCNKRKLFLELPMSRDIVANSDLAYAAIRKKFEQLTGIVCDAHMDTVTQVTFGIWLNDPKYAIPFDATSATGANQPKKLRKVIKNSSKNISSLQPAREALPKGQIVPISVGGYNHRYGRRPRQGGRFEWAKEHYVGYRNTRLTVIRTGHRHRTLAKLTKCAIYNMLRQNCDYGGAFTEADAYVTVLSIIKQQFEDSASFLKEESESIKAQLHMELKRAQTMPLEDYYKEASAESKNKERYKYTPRTHSAKALFQQNYEFFERCSNIQELSAKIEELAQGDLSIRKRLWRYYKASVPNALSETRGRPQKNYDDYIASCPISSNGALVVDRSHLYNACFRSWCKAKGLKLTRVINKSSKLLSVEEKG